MRSQIIGTTAVLISSPNAGRERWSLQMLPTSIAAGNTGKIFVGRGFIPVPTVGDPNQGEILVSGSAVGDTPAYEGDEGIWKGYIWAISDTASQSCTYDEQTTGDQAQAS